MSDFDFDELDEAVTGHFAKSGNEQENEPVRETHASPVEPVRVEVARPAASMPATHRGAAGRFMDMVHPSSDMRRQNSAPTRAAETAEARDSRPAEQPVVPAPKPVPQPERKYEPRVESTPAVKMPEPPVFITSDDETEDEGAPQEPYQKPLESPFLADAKVEKRPLGRAPETEPVFDLHATLDELLLEAPDEPLLEATATPDPIVDEEEVEVAEEAPRDEEKKSTASDELAGPTSIQQQYKEQPRTDDDQGGAIYDTEAYHQPIAHPAKKHSSVWTVLWILILVALGAGAGVAFYLYVLPLI